MVEGRIGLLPRGALRRQISHEQFRIAEVMLAPGMDGRPLSRAHGAPLGLVIPQMYGYKGVKWVSASMRTRASATGRSAPLGLATRSPRSAIRGGRGCPMCDPRHAPPSPFLRGLLRGLGRSSGPSGVLKRISYGSML